jgi:trimeric autotransporter adhesin
MNPLIQSKNEIILPVLITLALGCIALSPMAHATCQEGCLTNSNTVLGDDALVNNTGFNNTAIGTDALHDNTTGIHNTANGAFALWVNTTGSTNTATGDFALAGNTTGNVNTATGSFALSSNTTGGQNTATGFEALSRNIIGNDNTATGAYALWDDHTGNDNTANGAFALFFNNGDNNTATGFEALFNNAIGNDNTATGFKALDINQTGSGNTATGFYALLNNTTGNKNTATGSNALSRNTTGSFNVALGAEAGGNLTTGSNNIDIANRGGAGESDTIRIGTRQVHTNTFIAGINGVTVPTGVPVVIDIHGHIGTTTSSARFKEEIEPMGRASEAILALKPVSFRYRHELDSKKIPQFGLVAEQVEKVNPDLVARDDQGKPYTVRYEAVNAMLLNEFIKEHQTVQELKKQVAELAAGLQRVSAQLELSKSTTQTVLNNH